MTVGKAWRAKWILAAAAGAIGVAALVAGVAFMLHDSGERKAQVSERPGLNETSDGSDAGLLLVAGRDRLAICVEGVEAAAGSAQNARNRIEAAVVRLASHPAWSSSGLGVAPPEVSLGCPSDPYLLRPGVTFDNGKPVGQLVVPVVAQPSEYRVFVFALPPDHLAAVIRGPAGVRTAPQEAVCEGDQCATVSTGVYLSPVEFGDSEFVDKWLRDAIGIEPAIPVDGPAGPPPGKRPGE